MTENKNVYYYMMNWKNPYFREEEPKQEQKQDILAMLYGNLNLHKPNFAGTNNLEIKSNKKHKFCSCCGINKPVVCFQAHPYTKDRLQSQCRECQLKRVSKKKRDSYGFLVQPKSHYYGHKGKCLNTCLK